MAITGATTRQIAQSFTARGEKLSHVQVSKDIKSALAEMAEGNMDGADTLRGVFNQRYERLLMRMWGRAVGTPARRNDQGDIVQDEIPADEFALDRILRIMTEMRKMNGLDVDPQMGSEENPMHESYEEPKILLEGSVGSNSLQQTD